MIKGTIGIRLAFWYAGMFIGSVIVLVLRRTEIPVVGRYFELA